MISRIWHGWARGANADAYERLLRAEVLPGIRRIPGYLGAYLLRREHGDETEFVTITQFESLEAVKAFAGEEYERAVVPPAAQALLAHWDEWSAHYETVLTPGTEPDTRV